MSYRCPLHGVTDAEDYCTECSPTAATLQVQHVAEVLPNIETTRIMARGAVPPRPYPSVEFRVLAAALDAMNDPRRAREPLGDRQYKAEEALHTWIISRFPHLSQIGDHG